LKRPLKSVDVNTKQPSEAFVERTDTCIIPSLAVVCEAVTALVLAEAFMNKFGSDNMTEIERNHQTFLNTIY